MKEEENRLVGQGTAAVEPRLLRDVPISPDTADPNIARQWLDPETGPAAHDHSRCRRDYRADLGA